MIIAVLGLLIAGCSKDSPTENSNPQPTGDIIPLAVGNHWGGEQTVSVTGTPSQTIAYLITDDSVVNNETWYRLAVSSGGPPVFAGWITNRSDGVWIVAVESQLGTGEPVRYLAYPATAGSSYDIVMGLDTVEVQVISTGKYVTVPKGTYSCHQYRMILSGAGEDLFFSPGTGFVEITVSSSGVNANWKLDSLVLN
jgi:hypothetical protein